MGTPDFAVPSLRALLQSHHRVVGVVTQPDRPRGRGRSLSPPPVKTVAQAAGVPVLQPERMKDPALHQALRDLSPEVIVVAAFGRILPPPVLEIPPHGCLNVHASLLPKYRGAAPVNWAIIRGETVTGITIMRMDEGLDTGDILLQESLPIGPEETAGELSERLAHLGAALLLEALVKLEAGALTPTPQSHSEATYAPLLAKEDTWLDWRLPAPELVRWVRGLAPRPGAHAWLQGEPLRILRAEAVPGEGGRPGEVVALEKEAIRVATGQGHLRLLEVHPPGKRPMPVSHYLQGHRIPVGSVLQRPPDGGQGREPS